MSLKYPRDKSWTEGSLLSTNTSGKFQTHNFHVVVKYLLNIQSSR